MIGDVCHGHGYAYKGRIGVERLLSLTRGRERPYAAFHSSSALSEESLKKMRQSEVVRDPSGAGTPFLPNSASVS